MLVRIIVVINIAAVAVGDTNCSEYLTTIACHDVSCRFTVANNILVSYKIRLLLVACEY